MGKRTKLREARRRAVDEAIVARLRRQSRAKSSPGFIDSYCQFPAGYREKIESYRSFALRAPESWRCALRSRSPEGRFLELVRFTFTDYPVPVHLAQAWIGPMAIVGLEDEELPDLCRWYIAVGQGRSLYKDGACRFFSRLETHHFINAPDEVVSTGRAFWFAIARASGADAVVADRVARSRLSGFCVLSSFWKEAARFFAVNPTPILEMNDLIDFLRVAKQEDAQFSLRGRTLPALRRRMEEWHRDLRDIACGGRWRGRRQPDATYIVENAGERLIWCFRQIKSGGELTEEGRQMSHCVASYKDSCVSGAVSIWSLSCESLIGSCEHRLTIELRSDGCIAQCRGFANRPPSDEETAVVKRWAEEFGLTC